MTRQTPSMSTRPSRSTLAVGPSAISLYCHTCGRIISPRKSRAPQSTPQKYCSDRCRRERPRPADSTATDIERAFVRLLDDGGERRTVKCEEVERAVFTQTRTGGGVCSEGEELCGAQAQGEGGQSDAEEEAGNDEGGVKLPSDTEPHAAATTTPVIIKGLESGNRPQRSLKERGMQRAKEREMVRRAARRGVAFGLLTEEGERRRVEAIQGGRVVESSFAKGEWGVRWRE